MINVLRVIAVFIAADGQVSAKELNWFNWLINRHIQDPNEKKALLMEIRKPSNLDDLFKLISPLDHERILSWAEIAMKIDGVQLVEQKLYDKLRNLVKGANSGVHNLEYARSILAADNERAFWADLRTAGEFFGKHLSLGERLFYVKYLADGLFSGKPVIVWTMVIFFLLYILARFFAPLLLR